MAENNLQRSWLHDKKPCALLTSEVSGSIRAWGVSIIIWPKLFQDPQFPKKLKSLKVVVPNLQFCDTGHLSLADHFKQNGQTENLLYKEGLLVTAWISLQLSIWNIAAQTTSEFRVKLPWREKWIDSHSQNHPKTDFSSFHTQLLRFLHNTGKNIARHKNFNKWSAKICSISQITKRFASSFIPMLQY